MAICDHYRVDVLVRVAARLLNVGVERVCVEHAILGRHAPSRRVTNVEAPRA